MTSQAKVSYCENQVFLRFYKQFEIKTKLKQFRTLFLRHSLTTNLDTRLRRSHGEFNRAINEFEINWPQLFRGNNINAIQNPEIASDKVDNAVTIMTSWNKKAWVSER